MDIKELVEQSRSLLAEAEQAISEDNLELAQEKQQEVASVNEKIKLANTDSLVIVSPQNRFSLFP